MSNSKPEDSLLSKIQVAEQALAEVKSLREEQQHSKSVVTNREDSESSKVAKENSNLSQDHSSSQPAEQELALEDFFAEEEEFKELFANFNTELQEIKELLSTQLSEVQSLDQSRMDQSIADESGSDQPEVDHSGTDQSGTDQSGTEASLVEKARVDTSLLNQTEQLELAKKSLYQSKAQRVEEIRAQVAKIRAQSSPKLSLQALRDVSRREPSRREACQEEVSQASNFTNSQEEKEALENAQASASKKASKPLSYSRRQTSYQDALKAAQEYQAKKAAQQAEVAKQKQESLAKENLDKQGAKQEELLTKKEVQTEEGNSTSITTATATATTTTTASRATANLTSNKDSAPTSTSSPSDKKVTSSSVTSSVTTDTRVEDYPYQEDDLGFEEVESTVDYFSFSSDEEAEQQFNQQMATAKAQQEGQKEKSNQQEREEESHSDKKANSYLGVSKKKKLTYFAIALLVAIGFNLYGYFTSEHGEEEGYETLFTYFFKSKKESPLAKLPFKALSTNLEEERTIKVKSGKELVEYCFFSAVQRSDYLPAVLLEKPKVTTEEGKTVTAESFEEQKVLQLTNAHQDALAIDKVISNFSKAGLEGSNLEFIYKRVFANAALLFTLPYQNKGKPVETIEGKALNSKEQIARQEALDLYLHSNFKQQNLFYGLVSKPTLVTTLGLAKEEELKAKEEQKDRDLDKGQVSFLYQGASPLPLVRVETKEEAQSSLGAYQDRSQAASITSVASSPVNTLYFYRVETAIEGLVLQLALTHPLANSALTPQQQLEFGAGVFNVKDNSCTIVEKVELKAEENKSSN